jgi:hypothetical protein
MQIRQDGPRLILTDQPDRKTVGFLKTPSGRRLMLALLLVGAVMQVFDGRFLAWHIPAEWRWTAIAAVVTAFVLLELYATLGDRKALTTTFDVASRNVVQRGARGLGTVERHAPFSAFAGVEIADRPASRWRPSDPRYVLQARLTSGEVWPLTGPSIFRDELADCASAIEIKLAASL